MEICCPPLAKQCEKCQAAIDRRKNVSERVFKMLHEEPLDGVSEEKVGEAEDFFWKKDFDKCEALLTELGY